MTNPLDWSLLSGPVPVILLILTVVAFALLLTDRTRAWWTWKAPTALAIGAVLTAILGVIVDRWWKPFPEGLPTEVLLWMGVAILGATITAVRLPSLTWRRRTAALACAFVVGLTGLNQRDHERDRPRLPAAHDGGADAPAEPTVGGGEGVEVVGFGFWWP